MDTAETKETKADTKTEDVKEEKSATKDDKPTTAEEDDSPYVLPIRCDISVVCSEIEWVEEVTDEALNTTVDEETKKYPDLPMQISRA